MKGYKCPDCQEISSLEEWEEFCKEPFEDEKTGDWRMCPYCEDMCRFKLIESITDYKPIPKTKTHKSSLKNGMIVTLKNGKKGITSNEKLHLDDEVIYFINYNSDLNSTCHNRSYDVVKIEFLNQTIWERKLEVN